MSKKLCSYSIRHNHLRNINKYYFDANMMEIVSDLFFNLVDQFKKAKDEITALSMRLSVNNNAVTYTTKKKVIESNDDYEDEDK